MLKRLLNLMERKQRYMQLRLRRHLTDVQLVTEVRRRGLLVSEQLLATDDLVAELGRRHQTILIALERVPDRWQELGHSGRNFRTHAYGTESSIHGCYLMLGDAINDDLGRFEYDEEVSLIEAEEDDGFWCICNACTHQFRGRSDAPDNFEDDQIVCPSCGQQAGRPQLSYEDSLPEDEGEPDA